MDGVDRFLASSHDEILFFHFALHDQHVPLLGLQAVEMPRPVHDDQRRERSANVAAGNSASTSVTIARASSQRWHPGLPSRSTSGTPPTIRAG